MSCLVLLLVYVCVYSGSRNDVPQVAQRYGTIAGHTGAVRPWCMSPDGVP